MYPDSWSEILSKAYGALDSDYRVFLEHNQNYFPVKEDYFNAFKTLPKERVKYILFGQDPYPRKESAGGYAFIDMKVQNLFSSKGLSTEVNRATSLRNFIKMLLVESGDLNAEDTSQVAIAKIDKSYLIDSIEKLKENFEKSGVLLLNTALVFSSKKESNKHIKAWKPFMEVLLAELEDTAPVLILFGTHAKALKKQFDLSAFETIEIEHPYNHTFVHNQQAHELFGKMKLLQS
jgi:uracil-DNA glycosylase